MKLSLLLVLLVVISSTINCQDIDIKLLDYFHAHPQADEVSFLAVLKAKADVDRAISGVSFQDRGQVVFNELTATAKQSQEPLIAFLTLLNVPYKSFWIVNMLEIKANYSVMMKIASHVAVKSLKPNFQFRVELEKPEEDIPQGNVTAPLVVEWNIDWVKAPSVWAKGFSGQGLVVANADTGVQWNHPALLPQYRGLLSNGSVNHNYNWWDAVHATGSRCGASSPIPCDDNGHGTHTTGTAVGDDHAGNQIGVAPRAKWIACRNMNAGYGTPKTYIECLQFFVAPTDLSGNNPNPILRPHAIGNSYGCPQSEGCSADTLQEAVNNVIAAGIFMSVSAGNSGPNCYTVNDPPAIYANVMSVAASGYQMSEIASYSSRGPVRLTNGGFLDKPDITAPGSNVRSSYPTSTYSRLSGTSMASPHIAGMIALLWNARPDLDRDIVSTTKILELSATYRSATSCATPDQAADNSNNVYGHGELDALSAIGLQLD